MTAVRRLRQSVRQVRWDPLWTRQPDPGHGRV